MPILKVIAFACCLGGGYALFFAFTSSRQPPVEASVEKPVPERPPEAPAKQPEAPAPARDPEADRQFFKGFGGDANPVAEVSAAKLARDYRSDPVRADSVYEGKPVQVDGVVGDITMRQWKVAVVLDAIPGDGDRGTQIFCVLQSKFEKEAWSLARGQRVRILGKAQAPLGSFINVVNCRIQSREASPAVRVSAAELLESVAVGEKKHLGKPIVVEGIIVESREGETLIHAVRTTGGRMLKIKASWSPDLKIAFEKVVAGNQLTLAGECARFADDTIELKGCWRVPEN